MTHMGKTGGSPHPEKWRETVDPFSLPYKEFKLVKVLGYPHAGNDVFHAEGVFHGENVRVYIKAARQSGANIQNEVNILNSLNEPLFPKVIDCGFDGTPFSVTLELEGERLSVLLGKNEALSSLSYMREYGKTLARIHNLKLPAALPVLDRRFFHPPSSELLSKLDLGFLEPVFDQKPPKPAPCFCHGDFHYANILWKSGHIAGILDFELAGIGNRDFDIAWALLLRPGQTFLKTDEERSEFLRGYSELGEYDFCAVKRCMAQCFVYFLEFSGSDEEYCRYARAWLEGYAEAASSHS